MANDANHGLRRAVAERDGWSCAYCGVAVGEPCNALDDFESATLDHRTARVHGGGDDLDNLVLACQPCNSTKGIRPPSVMFA